jgi:hypothetical protein
MVPCACFAASSQVQGIVFLIEEWHRLVALVVAEWLQCTNSVGFVESFLCGFSVPFLSARTGVDLLAHAGIGKSIRVAIGFPFLPSAEEQGSNLFCGVFAH